MSFFDSIFGGTSTPGGVGSQVLQGFYDQASTFEGFDYPSYEAWLAFLVSRVSDIVTLIGELVISNSASTSINDAISRVKQLAEDSGGQASIPEIVAAAGGTGNTINWSSGVPEIISATVKDTAALAVETAQNVGLGVTSTLNLVKYLPWLLGGGAALYIFVLAKSSGGGIAKSLGSFKKNPRRKRQ